MFPVRSRLPTQAHRLIPLLLELQLRRHLAEEAYAMELSSRSPDFREGMKAFAERRSPGFHRPLIARDQRPASVSG